MKNLRGTRASRALIGLDQTRDDEEQLYAKRLVRLLGVPDSELLKRERPDFLLRFGSADTTASAALEVTRFSSDEGKAGSEEARFFKLWLAFAEALRADLAAANLGHIYGAVHFRETSRSGIPDQDRLRTEIVAAVMTASSERKLTDGDGLSSFDRERQPALFQNVDHIFLRDERPEKGLLWWCAHLQSENVPDPVDALRSRIAEKDTSAARYGWPVARERWLLIYAPARGVSDIAVLSDAIEPPLSSTAFDRVFLYDGFSQGLHQLCPKFRVLCDGRSIFVSRLPPFLPSYVPKAQTG